MVVDDQLPDVSDHPRTDYFPVGDPLPGEDVRSHAIRAVAAEHRRRLAGGVHGTSTDHATAFVDVALAVIARHEGTPILASTVDG